MSKLFIHAPGVHVGGGWILLRELLNADVRDNVHFQLDERVHELTNSETLPNCYYISSSVFGRIMAEIRLWLKVTVDDVILCFHGMPPILPVKGKIYVFQQNRLHLGKTSLSSFRLSTRLRLMVKQGICYVFKRNVSTYLVQTSSMKRDVILWHGGEPDVRVMPFMSTSMNEFEKSLKTVDFIYVADGEGHKNHKNLIDAWCLLANEGIFPSLALTLPDRNQELIDTITVAVAEKGLKVENFGDMTHKQIMGMYKSAKAMIFPSFLESFGLPLLEAESQGLPVIASERDYVRDVCQPIETFDPESPVSIARAVKRFMNICEPSLRVRSPDEFLQELFL